MITHMSDSSVHSPALATIHELANNFSNAGSLGIASLWERVSTNGRVLDVRLPGWFGLNDADD